MPSIGKNVRTPFFLWNLENGGSISQRSNLGQPLSSSHSLSTLRFSSARSASSSFFLLLASCSLRTLYFRSLFSSDSCIHSSPRSVFFHFRLHDIIATMHSPTHMFSINKFRKDISQQAESHHLVSMCSFAHVRLPHLAFVISSRSHPSRDRNVMELNLPRDIKFGRALYAYRDFWSLYKFFS